MRTIYKAVLAAGTALMMVISGLAEDGMRTWTSAAGTDLTAQFVEMRGGMAVLRTEDGRELGIPPANLSPADQDVLRRLAPPPPPPPPRTFSSATSNALSVFTGGDWNRAAAVYEAPGYVATLSGNGRQWRIQLRENGKDIGPPLTVQNSTDYHDPTYRDPTWRADRPDGRWFTRPVARFDNPPAEPMMNPRTLVLKGVLVDNVPFEFSAEFSPNRMMFEVALFNERSLKFPTRVGMSIRMQPSHTFPEGTSWDEITSVLQGHEITFVKDDRKAETLPYWEAFNTRSLRVQQITSSGPWGSRKVRIEGPRRKDRLSAAVGNYSDNEVFKGFTVSRGASGYGALELGSLVIHLE